MTATLPAEAPTRRRWPRLSRRARREPEPSPAEPTTASSAIPPLTPRQQVVRAALVIVFVLSFSMLLQLLIVSSLQQDAAQDRAFDDLRGDLAQGTAPIGPTDAEGRELAIGTPVAFLEIPELDVEQVVVEGTTPSALFTGPGHRRDTPLPGQAGVSMLLGRRAAYGGPFARVGELEPDDEILVTTGQGTFEFRVIGVRREGDPVPPPPGRGEARLLLATADGRPFLPNGVLRVDASLAGDAVVGPARIVSTAELPAAERLMGTDASTLWALALWLQALLILALGAVWAWHQWGHAQAWVVFLPLLLVAGLAASGQVARLLPNLL